jgi:hypothetical protein
MNKRSAILMALALTGALVAGGIALASGIGGPAASEASTTTAKSAEPVVRTKTRTVTIHRTAGRPAGRVVVLGGGSSATGTGSGSMNSTSGSSGDEGPQNETENEGPENEGDDGPTSGSGAENSGSGDAGSHDAGHGGRDD